MSLDLFGHGERITDVCEKAKKQLDIEVSLKNISHIWKEDESSKLDIESLRSPYDNEYYHKIRSIEVVMQLIDEHST